MRELKSLMILVASILTYIILLPFAMAVAVIRVLRSILKITEDTTTYFMGAVQKEITKQE